MPHLLDGPKVSLYSSFINIINIMFLLPLVRKQQPKIIAGRGSNDPTPRGSRINCLIKQDYKFDQARLKDLYHSICYCGMTRNQNDSVHHH